jgi:hypothetical protein
MPEPARSLITRTIGSAPRDRADFETWQDAFAYETLQLDGVRSARRYVLDRDPNCWITVHDVDADRVEAVLADEYRRLRTAPDGPRFVERALRWENRRYRALPVPAIARADDDQAFGALANFVFWTPRPGTEGELSAWYDDEHIPLLMGVPEWLRIRRFELVGDDSPRFLAIHDLASARALEHPLQAAAGTTPWRSRVIADRLQYSVVPTTLVRVL